MKKAFLYGILAFTLCIIACYHYHERVLPCNLVFSIEKPCKEFDNTQFTGIKYCDSRERFKFFMGEYWEKRGICCYDSIVIDELCNKLDFVNYDYIITYHKQLKHLKYSPHLSHTKDLISKDEDKRTPLIPVFNSANRDSLYIYRILNNDKFRSPGP